MPLAPAFALLLVSANPMPSVMLGTTAVPGAPIAGGWSRIDKPARNPEVIAAAQAIVAQLPGGQPRLRRIESAQSQVVAGTNYRLVVRLQDRTRWSATVWHTLQNTYEVSELKRLR